MADRAAFLVDAAAYFEAFMEAASRAERCIYLVGWDFHSQLQLVRNGETQPTHQLGAFLNDLARRRPDLRIYLLAWDFAMIFALEREPLPIFRLGWKTHPRVQFRADGEHPIGASHHEKIVVIDDRVAFAGGIDLTQHRWDTPEHVPDDPRRVSPAGAPYPPFHDAQMLVSGAAAEALGNLVRARWLSGTGTTLPAPERVESDPWPTCVAPDLKSVPVGIARTRPAYKDQEEIREVEALYLDAIARAEKWIYIENQYFTSGAVRQALEKCLRADHGPEVVMVLPHATSGWLEQHTMDAIRARAVEALMLADQHGRLGLYTPWVSGADDAAEPINVHAKVMVVDDVLARVGSSNLSNRSMGLDTECDLAVASDGIPDRAAAIAGFRNRLLAEHCEQPEAAIAGMLSETDSLHATVKAFAENGRLRPLRIEDAPWLPASGDATTFLDPEKPVAVDEMIDAFVEREPPRSSAPGGEQLVKPALLLVALVSLALIWRMTPAAQWVQQDAVTAWMDHLTGHPATPLLVLGGFVLAALAMFPIVLLISAVAIIFDPWTAISYSAVGCMVGALLGYGIGHLFGREVVKSLPESWINRSSRQLAKRGLMAVLVVRLLPVAPFTVINLVSGASHISLKHFLLGTLLGMAPGILVLSLFMERIRAFMQQPDFTNVLWVLLVGAGALLLLLWVRRRIYG